MAKINTYKLVNTPKVSNTASPEVKTVGAVFGATTFAINGLGKVLTGVAQTSEGLFKVAKGSLQESKLREQAERRKRQREEDRKREEEFENRKLNTASAGEGIKKPSSKEKSWLEKVFGGLFGWLAPLAKGAFTFLAGLFTLRAVQDIQRFLEDPRARDKLVVFLTKLKFVWDKIVSFSSWLIKDNLLDGFSKTFGSNRTAVERLEGLGQILIGIVGLKALLNPFGLMRDIMGLMQSRANEMNRAAASLRKREAVTRSTDKGKPSKDKPSSKPSAKSSKSPATARSSSSGKAPAGSSAARAAQASATAAPAGSVSAPSSVRPAWAMPRSDAAGNQVAGAGRLYQQQLGRVGAPDLKSTGPGAFRTNIRGGTLPTAPITSVFNRSESARISRSNMSIARSQAGQAGIIDVARNWKNKQATLRQSLTDLRRSATRGLVRLPGNIAPSIKSAARSTAYGTGRAAGTFVRTTSTALQGAGAVGKGVVGVTKATFSGVKSLLRGSKAIFGRIPWIGSLIYAGISLLDFDENTGSIKLNLDPNLIEKTIYKTVGMAVGTAAGSFILPPIGTIAGGIIGDYAGEMIYELVKGTDPKIIGQKLVGDVSNLWDKAVAGGAKLVGWAKTGIERLWSTVPKLRLADFIPPGFEWIVSKEPIRSIANVAIPNIQKIQQGAISGLISGGNWIGSLAGKVWNSFFTRKSLDEGDFDKPNKKDIPKPPSQAGVSADAESAFGKTVVTERDLGQQIVKNWGFAEGKSVWFKVGTSTYRALKVKNGWVYDKLVPASITNFGTGYQRVNTERGQNSWLVNSFVSAMEAKKYTTTPPPDARPKQTVDVTSKEAFAAAATDDKNALLQKGYSQAVVDSVGDKVNPNMQVASQITKNWGYATGKDYFFEFKGNKYKATKTSQGWEFYPHKEGWFGSGFDPTGALARIDTKQGKNAWIVNAFVDAISKNQKGLDAKRTEHSKIDTGAAYKLPKVAPEKSGSKPTTPMTNLPSGSEDSIAIEMIKIHEGHSLEVYRDKEGYLTVGYGHLIDSGSPEDIRNLKEGDVISEQRANELFIEDYKHHKQGAQKMPGYSSASTQQKAALIDLAFNMGVGWYNKFPKFLKAFMAGDFETAGEELRDSAWFNQVGRRAAPIISLIKNKGTAGASHLSGLMEKVTQGLGTTVDAVRGAITGQPTQKRRLPPGVSLSSNYGVMRPTGPHGGTDIAAPSGTPLVAVTDGEIVDYGSLRETGAKRGDPNGWGNFVVFKDDRGVYHLYGHVLDGFRTSGKVKAGDQIAKVGSTGRSSGPHLHWEIGSGWTGGVLSGKSDPLSVYKLEDPFVGRSGGRGADLGELTTTVPGRKPGQKAILNGEPVVWTGSEWVSETSAAGVASASAGLLDGILLLPPSRSEGQVPIGEDKVPSIVQMLQDGLLSPFMAPEGGGSGIVGGLESVGKVFVDTAGNLVNSAGNILGRAGSAAREMLPSFEGSGEDKETTSGVPGFEGKDPGAGLEDDPWAYARAQEVMKHPLVESYNKLHLLWEDILGIDTEKPPMDPENNNYGNRNLPAKFGVKQVFGELFGTPGNRPTDVQYPKHTNIIQDAMIMTGMKSPGDFPVSQSKPTKLEQYASSFMKSSGGEVTPLPNNLRGYFFKAIGNFFKKAFEGIKNVVTSIVNSPIFKVISTAISILIPPLAPIVAGINAVGSLMQGDIIGAVVGGFGALGGMFPGTFGAEGSFFGGLNNALGDGLGGVVKGFLTGGIGGAIGGIGGMLPEGIKGLFGAMGGFMDKNPMVKNLMSAGIANIPGLGQVLGPGLAAAGLSPSQAIENNAQAAGGLLSSVINAGLGMVSKAMGLEQGAVSAGVNPAAMGVPPPKGPMMDPKNESLRQMAQSSPIETVHIPIIIEKLVPIKEPVPVIVHKEVPVQPPPPPSQVQPMQEQKQ